MAAGRKPQQKKLKFELSKSGIGGIAVVAFCLFLWMFLLGVWAGQSLLIPSPGKKVQELTDQREEPAPPLIRADKMKKKRD